MINDRSMLICDDCGRQIVTYRISDKTCIGTGDEHTNKVMLVGVNKHACIECIPSELDWEEMVTGIRPENPLIFLHRRLS